MQYELMSLPAVCAAQQTSSPPQSATSSQRTQMLPVHSSMHTPSVPPVENWHTIWLLHCALGGH
jgi:hypothetical protein